MPPPRFFAGDEELGKRNDDHRPRNTKTVSPLWPAPFRFRRRRVPFAMVALLCLFLFYKGITFNPSQDDVDDPEPSRPPIPSGPPPREVLPPENEGSEASRHYFTGPIKFYKLASSLREISKYRQPNRNVLFAAASLKSAAAMIPLACEMARWNRNRVHFAVQGRDELPLRDIQEINGVGPECNIDWHDGRPDYSPYSSDLRFKVTVSAGLGHIDDFMHPQAIILDDSGQEEAEFLRSFRDKARELGKTVINLPGDAAENMMWITRLDSGSLSGTQAPLNSPKQGPNICIAWDKTDLDILIHVPPDSLGNLKRLLRSLHQVEFFSSAPPRLTIELPSTVDIYTRRFLEDFKWPPFWNGIDQRTNRLTLRHRIPSQITTEEATIRFFESFYPSNPSNSHVLLLSPQTQLSPLFFHYLKYTLLEYKYSSYRSEKYDDIFGIAFDLPSTHLNGTTPFTAPKWDPLQEEQRKPSSELEQTSAFLWQAPSSSAALYFGSGWVELHDFLKNRFEVQHRRKVKSSPKLVSEKQPPWMNSLLEFMRLRGYHMLYPPFSVSDGIATAHNELLHTQEEFSDTTLETPKKDQDADSSFTTDPSNYLASSRNVEKALTSKRSLISLLPLEGDLPEPEDLTALSYDGTSISIPSVNTEQYTASFRRDIGGCGAREAKKRVQGSTADLFCADDDEDEEEETRELEREEEIEKAKQRAREEVEAEEEDEEIRGAKAEKGKGVITWLRKLNTPSAARLTASATKTTATRPTDAAKSHHM
ncbi:MAG: hypothetical protein M1837_007110 [Sclerophora amabilis]|nr:MAG: hypothetical protein M1837_007110 [Sclerophora amabilis]